MVPKVWRCVIIEDLETIKMTRDETSVASTGEKFPLPCVSVKSCDRTTYVLKSRIIL